VLRTKVLRPEVKGLDADTFQVDAVMSTEAEDRDREIIRQDGWQLDQFNDHPVLLSSHNYWSLRSQIGKWLDVRVEGDQLLGTAQYFVGRGNEEADWGWQLATQGQAAYSVGFIALEFQDREDIDTEGMFWPPQEYTSMQLLEISAVSVPANAEALQVLSRSKGVHPVVDEIVQELLATQPAKQGRVMSASNLTKFHDSLASLVVVHDAVCDLDDECPLDKAATPKVAPPAPPSGGEPPSSGKAPDVGAFRQLIESVYPIGG
jgi:hypothetical protein